MNTFLVYEIRLNFLGWLIILRYNIFINKSSVPVFKIWFRHNFFDFQYSNLKVKHSENHVKGRTK